MVKINELNTNKIKKTGNSKLYKNFAKLFMVGFLSTSLTGCAPEEQITDPGVVDPADPVEEKTELEILAEEYDHLQWYLDDSTTKTVDGVTYDLVSLKQQYGDLYRFVEPLSKEEVEYRFQYLAEFFQIQVQDGDFEIYNGGLSEIPSKSATDFFALRSTFYKKMATTSDEKLKKYSSYYFFLEKAGKYYKNETSILKDINGMPELINVVDEISFDDKDWFVRNYMAETEIILKTLEKNNEKPVFNFETEQRTK